MNKSHNGVIGTLTLYSIVILAVGLMNHVMVIPPLLEEAKRDAWISILTAIVPYLAWTTILYYIMIKTNRQPLFLWLKQQFGGAVSWAFRIFFIVYLFVIGVMTLKETMMWTHTSYLPKTPTSVLGASLMLVCGFAVHFGVRAIAVASGILLPFVVIFGDFVMSANLPQKNYSLLTPYFEHGIGPTIRGSIYLGGGLVELILLLLLQHQLKSKVPLWSVYLLALFLALLVFGPVTAAIAEFGPYEAADLRYPAYEEWRLVTIGKYIRHVDFLSIYQWLSGAFVRIAVSVFLLFELLGLGQNKNHRTLGLWIIGAVYVAIAELPISDMQYYAFLKKVYLPSSLAGVTVLSFVLLLLVIVSKTRKVKHHET
ncbi:endospore germination permease [Paenibacillus thermotolerans]|uniref:endospore germination permease n=1 Tax=Paenibacillus thermotolerans TaxID=3027807 RepID=UPI00236748ED|nr:MULTISPECIES: endospore germination permease [unclassified Paenibacillus]